MEPTEYKSEFQTNDLDTLVRVIKGVGNALRRDARVVINRNVTARAWLTGYYIVEYEQCGADRAKYGTRLLHDLSERLGGKSYSVTNLRSYRLFYTYYPALQPVVTSYILSRFQSTHQEDLRLLLPPSIQQSVTAELMERQQIQQSVTAESPLSAEPKDKIMCSSDGFAMLLPKGNVEPIPQKFFDYLSFTHIVQLLHIEDEDQRAFYAIEAMRGTWSVRELQRQIDTNYYIRSGWSRNKEALAMKVNRDADKALFECDLKSPYYFEFLGLSSRDVIEEKDLEAAIVSHLRNFILELGMGFCLEEEQKRLLIDDRYYKVDLVFYHRVLKCHCIVELKAKRLDYADVAQLNMYIEYYRKHVMLPDDNPPVGLLLCTEYGSEMVEYLAPFVDPQIFVARYELQLPSKERIKDFLMRENLR